MTLSAALAGRGKRAQDESAGLSKKTKKSIVQSDTPLLHEARHGKVEVTPSVGHIMTFSGTVVLWYRFRELRRWFPQERGTQGQLWTVLHSRFVDCELYVAEQTTKRQQQK